MLLISVIVLVMTLACARTALPDDSPTWQVPGQGGEPQPLAMGMPTKTPFLPPARQPGEPILTPTPDAPHPLPALRTEPEQYAVQPGDTLGIIASIFGISLEELIGANELINPNILEVGQILTVPVPSPKGVGPDFKIIPDSELVYGPASIFFDIEANIDQHGGYLAEYEEELEDQTLTGAQIVKRISEEYSVNPRLLLAVLEYQSQWLTQPKPDKSTLEYPIGVRDEWRSGLYMQLAWAANNLNRGYYLWKINGIATWLIGDGTVVPIAPTINAGTAGVQHMFAPLYSRSGWEQAISAEGLFATYNQLFGYPFDYAVEPLVPDGIHQPRMQLPFEPGADWYYTGGPHGGWGDGSAWAALDFAPYEKSLGCLASNAWIVAMVDGLVLRSENGVVLQDLDGDGLEQTGWTILYLHVDSQDRISAGTYLKAGDRVGHPSCEGGVSSGTHLHVARRYNGEWIPADQTLPFVLDGWVSRGTGQEYDGYLEREGGAIEAWGGGRSDLNAIQR